MIRLFLGTGATIDAFLSYDIIKRSSKEPETFGTGNTHGVTTAKAANNSSVGGALITLLTLGIPGSATDAVLIGVLMIYHLNPGAQLFISHPVIVYGIFASLMVTNFVMLALGFLGSKAWVNVAKVLKILCIL